MQCDRPVGKIALTKDVVKQEEMEVAALQRLNDALLEGKPARAVPLSADERKAVDQLCLLTMKPTIFAANVAETDLADPSSNPHVQKVRKVAEGLNSEVVVVSAQVGLHVISHD